MNHVTLEALPSWDCRPMPVVVCSRRVDKYVAFLCKCFPLFPLCACPIRDDELASVGAYGCDLPFQPFFDPLGLDDLVRWLDVLAQVVLVCHFFQIFVYVLSASIEAWEEGVRGPGILGSML